MDFKLTGSSNPSENTSHGSMIHRRPPSCPNQNPSQFSTMNHLSNSNSDSRIQQSVHEPQSCIADWSFPVFDPDQDVKMMDHLKQSPAINSALVPSWDPRVILSNLSFVEQKVHQLQEMVRLMTDQESNQLTKQDCEVAAQQQLVTADLTSILIQLISTAGTLLPSIKISLPSAKPSPFKPNESIIPVPANLGSNRAVSEESHKVADYEDLEKHRGSGGREDEELMKYMVNGDGGEGVIDSVYLDDPDARECDDGLDGENLPPGSYEVLQLEKEEILAPHTHFCMICGKGFKRDANLRMHMRGHGDEYKTPAALAKPSKETNSEPMPIKRYSCPFIGCKRNKDHKKFQPLKTILCVKNHYKRSHCDKSYTCSRCKTKKFSVIADLKTHEKHCGRDRWLCSCGTTFSRKDKLFGHVALFQGHTPALPPVDEGKVSPPLDQAMSSSDMASGGSMGYNFGSTPDDDINLLDIKDVDDERSSFFSVMNFDACGFPGLDDLARQGFDVSDSTSFPIIPGNFNGRNANGTKSAHLG